MQLANNILNNSKTYRSTVQDTQDDVETINRKIGSDFIAPTKDHYEGSICMSGAIPEGVCRNDIEAQLTHQPYRLLNKTELVELELFNDPYSYDCLPSDFLTTNVGLNRAQQFIEHHNGEENDDVIVLALLRVGGKIPSHKHGNRVHYPEDMVPILGSKTDGDAWYWNEIELQGGVWTTMPRFLWHEE